jgi:hypothetical protein
MARSSAIAHANQRRGSRHEFEQSGVHDPHAPVCVGEEHRRGRHRRADGNQSRHEQLARRSTFSADLHEDQSQRLGDHVYIGLTSNSVTAGQIYDYGSTQVGQRISILPGVRAAAVAGLSRATPSSRSVWARPRSPTSTMRPSRRRSSSLNPRCCSRGWTIRGPAPGRWTAWHRCRGTRIRAACETP